MICHCILWYSCLSLSHTSFCSAILPTCSLYFSSCVLMTISYCSLSCSRPFICSWTLSAFFCKRKVKRFHSYIAVYVYHTHWKENSFGSKLSYLGPSTFILFLWTDTMNRQENVHDFLLNSLCVSLFSRMPPTACRLQSAHIRTYLASLYYEVQVKHLQESWGSGVGAGSSHDLLLANGIMGIDHMGPLMNRMTDTQDWQDYLPAISLTTNKHRFLFNKSLNLRIENFNISVCPVIHLCYIMSLFRTSYPKLMAKPALKIERTAPPG